MATPANAENDALVKTLADLLAEVEVDTLGERRTKENAEAQEGTQAKKNNKVQVNTFGDLLFVVEAHAQPRH